MHALALNGRPPMEKRLKNAIVAANAMVRHLELDRRQS